MYMYVYVYIYIYIYIHSKYIMYSKSLSTNVTNLHINKYKIKSAATLE